MTRPTAQLRLAWVGDRLVMALAAPRRVARRAYGRVSTTRSADSASPIAAACPIAGPPTTTPLRIAHTTVAAESAECSTTLVGSARWSTKRMNRAVETERRPERGPGVGDLLGRRRLIERGPRRVEDRARHLGRGALERLGGTDHRRRGVGEVAGELAEESPSAEVGAAFDRSRRRHRGRVAAAAPPPSASPGPAASVGSSLAVGSANGWPSGAVGSADARLRMVST